MIVFRYLSREVLLTLTAVSGVLLLMQPRRRRLLSGVLLTLQKRRLRLTMQLRHFGPSD